MSYGDYNEKKAKELMSRSKVLKQRADEIEFREKMQMKAGKRGSGTLYGAPTMGRDGKLVQAKYSYGEQALKDAAEDRRQAKKDSLEAVKLMKPAAIVSPVKRPSEAVMKKLTGKK